MSELSASIEQYLALRRSLGFKLELAARLLGQFADYCDQHGAGRVTIEVAVAWATAPAGASPGWWAQRLGVVRLVPLSRGAPAAWCLTCIPTATSPPS